MSTHANDESPCSSASTTTPAELAVGALGGLFVVCAFVFFGWSAVTVREGDPELEATVTRVDRSSAEQYAVHFTVANDGGVTAEQVHVVGELRRDGETLEEVSATLPYVPVESSSVTIPFMSPCQVTGQTRDIPATVTRPRGDFDATARGGTRPGRSG